MTEDDVRRLVHESAEKMVKEFGVEDSDEQCKLFNLSLMLANAYMMTGQTFWELVVPDKRECVMRMVTALIDKGMSLAEKVVGDVMVDC